VLNSSAAKIDESSYKVRPLAQPEADAVRADFLAYEQRTADAQTLLDSVLKADPNNVQAHDAVKYDSQNYFAQFYYAVLEMESGEGGHDAEIESSLRAAIRLNPRFAPAYDRLAAFLGMRHEKLDEAHLLSLQAIQLDPGSVGYRVNAANLFVEMERYADAVTVLKNALKLAKTPGETQMLQGRIAQFEQFEGMRKQAQMQADQQAKVTTSIVNEPAPMPAPKHPTEPANGPRHALEGVIRGVKCTYPAVIEFRVEAAKKTVSLYSNDYFKLDVSALGFTPSGDLHPCSDLEGMKAKVQYADSSDKTVDGQAVAIELHK
jgi:tetratricopeptide (TPR) repeat protein